MAYTTKAEIESEFKNTSFGASTNVTETDVNGFISEYDAVINTFVGARYSVPVDASASPVAYALMKLFSRTLTASRVRDILTVKQNGNADANQEVRGKSGFSVKDVMDMLKNIKDGKTDLADGVLILSSGLVSDYNSENCIEAVMKKEERQW